MFHRIGAEMSSVYTVIWYVTFNTGFRLRTARTLRQDDIICALTLEHRARAPNSEYRSVLSGYMSLIEAHMWKSSDCLCCVSFTSGTLAKYSMWNPDDWKILKRYHNSIMGRQKVRTIEQYTVPGMVILISSYIFTITTIFIPLQDGIIL